MSTSAFSSPTRRSWLKVIEQQESSGLSVAAFCRREAIAPASLYAWRRRLNDAGVGRSFVEARLVERRPPAGAIQIRLRRGRRLIVRGGFDHSLLAEIVSVVEGLP